MFYIMYRCRDIFVWFVHHIVTISCSLQGTTPSTKRHQVTHMYPLFKYCGLWTLCTKWQNHGEHYAACGQKPCAFMSLYGHLLGVLDWTWIFTCLGLTCLISSYRNKLATRRIGKMTLQRPRVLIGNLCLTLILSVPNHVVVSNKLFCNGFYCFYMWHRFSFI